MYTFYPEYWQLPTTRAGVPPAKWHISKTNMVAAKTRLTPKQMEKLSFVFILLAICAMMLTFSSAKATVVSFFSALKVTAVYVVSLSAYPEYDQNQDKTQNQETEVYVNAVILSTVASWLANVCACWGALLCFSP